MLLICVSLHSSVVHVGLIEEIIELPFSLKLQGGTPGVETLSREGVGSPSSHFVLLFFLFFYAAF